MLPSEVFKKSAFYKFGTNLFLIVLLGAVISAIMLYYIFPKELPQTYAEALKELVMLKENLHLKTYLIYLPVAFFIFAGVFVLSRAFTKRIVLPLHSISDFSKVLASGDFSKRPSLSSDELAPLVARINEMIDVYKDRFHLLKEDMAKLEKIQKNIEDHLDKNHKKQLKSELKELIEITEHMDGILAKIRV